MCEVARGLVLLVLVLAGGGASATERLMWHEVRLDGEGKLVSWVKTGAPYDRIIRNAWEAFKHIPVQPDGYRTYFTHPASKGIVLNLCRTEGSQCGYNISTQGELPSGSSSRMEFAEPGIAMCRGALVLSQA
jgi:hypothetical protein